MSERKHHVSVSENRNKPGVLAWMRRTRRSKWYIVLSLLAGAFLFLLVSPWPGVFGGPLRPVIVSGESMEPTFHTGDLILVWKTRNWGVGDLVTYRLDVPGGDGGLVIHRIVSGNPVDGWITKGDNKPLNDGWTVPNSSIVGEEVAYVPAAGKALAWLRSPIVLAMLAGGFVTGWIVMGMDDGKKKDDEDTGEEDYEAGETPEGDDEEKSESKAGIGAKMKAKFSRKEQSATS